MWWLACAPDPSWVPGEVALGPEREWSRPEPSGDQHHATVTALGPGRAAVAYTDGPLAGAYQSWVRELDNGEPVSDWLLDGGGPAAKPDLEVDRDGRLVVGYQSLAMVVEREGEAPVALGDPDEALGNNSVDLAVDEGGQTWAVWYSQEPPLGRYHAATLDAGLAPVQGLPAVWAEVEDLGPSTPDIAAYPDGDLGVAWVDQWLDGPDNPPNVLYLERFGPRGETRWRTALAEEEGELQPRRATVVTRADGSAVVGWRLRADGAPTPSSVWLAVVDAEGALVRGPWSPASGDTDDLVVAAAGEEAVWVAWTQVESADGLGAIVGGVLRVADGAWTVAPATLSSAGTASRPHAATRPTPSGAALAVSWEQEGEDGVRRVWGRFGALR